MRERVKRRVAGTNGRDVPEVTELTPVSEQIEKRRNGGVLVIGLCPSHVLEIDVLVLCECVELYPRQCISH